jgi:hypothetical protein
MEQHDLDQSHLETAEDIGPIVTEEKLQEIRATILDVSLGMPKRFRCVFTLRNIGGPRAIDILVEGIGTLVYLKIFSITR